MNGSNGRKGSNMKYTTIKEHHLYDKAFRKGARYSGRYVSVFVLRDYAAKRLMLANPEKNTITVLVFRYPRRSAERCREAV